MSELEKRMKEIEERRAEEQRKRHEALEKALDDEKKTKKENKKKTDDDDAEGSKRPVRKEKDLIELNLSKGSVKVRKSSIEKMVQAIQDLDVNNSTLNEEFKRIRPEGVLYTVQLIDIINFAIHLTASKNPEEAKLAETYKHSIDFIVSDRRITLEMLESQIITLLGDGIQEISVKEKGGARPTIKDYKIVDNKGQPIAERILKEVYGDERSPYYYVLNQKTNVWERGHRRERNTFDRFLQYINEILRYVNDFYLLMMNNFASPNNSLNKTTIMAIKNTLNDMILFDQEGHS